MRLGRRLRRVEDRVDARVPEVGQVPDEDETVAEVLAVWKEDGVHELPDRVVDLVRRAASDAGGMTVSDAVAVIAAAHGPEAWQELEADEAFWRDEYGRAPSAAVHAEPNGRGQEPAAGADRAATAALGVPRAEDTEEPEPDSRPQVRDTDPAAPLRRRPPQL